MELGTSSRALVAAAAIAIAIPWTTHAQRIEESPYPAPTAELAPELTLAKDPMLAAILSSGTPGLGQIYVGRWQRGLAFLGGIAASLVAAGIAADPIDRDFDEYLADRGIDPAVATVHDYDDWTWNRSGDFGDLSATRKAVAIGGVGAALGLYIWNIFDARSCAREHNRQLVQRTDRVQFGFGVGPDGVPRGQLSFRF